MMRDEYAMRDGSGNVEGAEAKKTGGTGVDAETRSRACHAASNTLGVHAAPRLTGTMVPTSQPLAVPSHRCPTGLCSATSS